METLSLQSRRTRSRHILLSAIRVSALTFLILRNAAAFIPTRDQQGNWVKWKTSQGTVKFNLVGNPKNNSGLTRDSLFSSVVSSLEQWKTASRGQIQYDYWQGDDPRDFETDSDYDGRSSLYFASQSQTPMREISDRVLGLTQVWYDTNSGRILETDIILNDLHFQFTRNPADTSSKQLRYSSLSGEQLPLVFIENVLTHEVGHALGLAHSGALQSSMLFVESPEQAYTSCDDQAGIREMYPSTNRLTGRITGRIITHTGRPVFGAQVSAISLSRGTVLTAVLTEPDGTFELSGLVQGSYSLMVEPFFAGAPALPPYYGSIQMNVCPGGIPFGRGFVTESDSKTQMRVLEVIPSNTTLAGELTVQCTGSARIAAVPAVLSQNSPDTLSETSVTLHPISAGAQNVFDLGWRGGDLRVKTLSFSLYSPVSLRLRLIDSAGRIVITKTERPVYSSESGYRNFDSSLEGTQLPEDRYQLQIEAIGVNQWEFPAGTIALDSQSFAVIAIGDPEAFGPTHIHEYPTNSRCTFPKSTLSYQSPEKLPARTMSGQKSGGCGTTAEASEPSAPSESDHYGTLSEILGWIFTWIIPAIFIEALGLARKTLQSYSLIHDRKKSPNHEQTCQRSSNLRS